MRLSRDHVAMIVVLLIPCTLCWAGELAGHQLLITSVRTGDMEVFVVDPEFGDAINVSRSPKSEDRYPCWSPDGSNAHIIECLRFRCAIDGSRAAWKPR